jgi:uncharacterized protein (TIGR02453 family)
MGDTFVGWRGDFQGFFLGLRANNSKAYFDSHRRMYEEEVKGPMVALLADLEGEFGPAHLARPNRDIRFAADKSPYKLNIYASAHEGGYVALDATGLVAAGGRYIMDAAQLARFRKAIAAEKSGGELVGIVAALRKKGYDVEGQELKRVPPPYPQDHPWGVARGIAPARARDRVAEVWRAGAPLNSWLAKHLDG